MSLEIFKLCYLKNNKIDKIDVYNGNEEYEEKNMTEVYATNNAIFEEIFNEEELQNVLDNKIPVFFQKTQIFIDDTLETIKKKIIQRENIAFEEIYLFCSYTGTLNPASVYKYLTQNKIIELNKIRLIQFLLNINYKNIEGIPDKDIYTYDDILALQLDDKEFLINEALGEKFSVRNQPLSFLVNPYNTIVYDPILETSVNDFILTTNKSLLMTNFKSDTKIHNNTIYVCNAKDVLNNIKEKDLSIEMGIKIYFPFLIKQDVLSIELLAEKSHALLAKSKELINTISQICSFS